MYALPPMESYKTWIDAQPRLKQVEEAVLRVRDGGMPLENIQYIPFFRNIPRDDHYEKVSQKVEMLLPDMKDVEREEYLPLVTAWVRNYAREDLPSVNIDLEEEVKQMMREGYSTIPFFLEDQRQGGYCWTAIQSIIGRVRVASDLFQGDAELLDLISQDKKRHEDRSEVMIGKIISTLRLY